VPFDIVGSTELRDSLLRIGYWVTDHGISGSGEFQSARKLLVRERPCVLRDFIGALIGEDQQLTGAAKVLLQSLASAATVLPIQGPPGYLDNLSKLNRAEKTLMAYRYTLTEWRKVCCKTYLDELVHQDLIDYIGSMKDAGLSRRTQDNRITTVKTFLMSVKKVCPLGLAIAVKDVRCSVKFVEKAVKAYTRTELAKLFAAADPEEWLLYHFFLATGARDEEVQTACYSDISDDGVYTVYVHPEWKFSPKDFECREVGVLPDYLLNAIRKRERISALIFPAKHGGRNHKMLRQLQALAVRAGLDPKSVGLHKFRKSFATFLHENGTSARTIQKRLGHSSLETTLAYLEAADVRSESSRATVNETFTPFAATNLSQESSIQ